MKFKRNCFLSIVLWLFISYVIYAVFAGREKLYEIDECYQLSGSPGYLMCTPESTGMGWGKKIEEEVIRIGILDEFIIGQTNEGWFGINRVTHELFYPYDSSTELKEKTGDIFSESQIKEHPSFFSLRGIGLVCILSLVVCIMLILINLTEYLTSKK